MLSQTEEIKSKLPKLTKDIGWEISLVLHPSENPQVIEASCYPNGNVAASSDYLLKQLLKLGLKKI